MRLRYDKPPDVTVVRREDRGGYYYYRFVFLGSAYKRCSGVKNKSEAQSIGDKHATDVWTAWKTGAAAAMRQASASPALAPEIAKFVTEQYGESAASTVTEVRRVLGWIPQYGGIGYVHEVTLDVMTQVYATVKEKHAPAAATRRNALNIWNKFFEHQMDVSEKSGKKYFTVNPIRKFKRPRARDFGRRTDVWPEEMYLKMVAHADIELAEAMRVIRWTGLDPLDYAMLMDRHVEIDANGILEIRMMRSKAKFGSEKIKQPIDPEISKLFHARKKKAAGNPNYLYFTADAGIYHEDAIEFYRRAKNWAAALTKRRLRLFRRLWPDYPIILDLKHLRHTYATYMATHGGPEGKGVSERVLREWMGHAPSSRTLEQIYLHIQTTSQYLRRDKNIST